MGGGAGGLAVAVEKKRKLLGTKNIMRRMWKSGAGRRVICCCWGEEND